jgi:GTPase
MSNIFDNTTTTTSPIGQQKQQQQQQQQSDISFTINSIKYTIAELSPWLSGLLDENNGEVILTAETTRGGKSLGEALSAVEKQLNISINVLRERHNSENQQQEQQQQQPSFIVDFLIRRRYDSGDFIEVRVAIVGNVDSGKSTLLAVLTHDLLDNGRGEARIKIFKHKHEHETGRTSSIGDDVLGFDASGRTVNNNNNNNKSLGIEKICSLSSKVVSFCDLAGHEKYFKTTVFGMTGYYPDFCMLMIGANMGLVGMTKEHLGLALALSVPVFIVVTKIDICPPNVQQENMRILQKILKSPGCRKMPYFVETASDVVTCALNFSSERLCPIFLVSNVTGKNIDLLRSFLNLLNSSFEACVHEPAEFELHAINSVPGVGTVLSGTCFKGTIRVNDTVLLGPDPIGRFKPITIKSMHRKRVAVSECKSGQTVSFAVKRLKRSDLRKGMFLLSESLSPVASWCFEAEILVLHHPTTIQKNYQAVVHCGSIRQSARIIDMYSLEQIRTGERCTVKLAFLLYPEYLSVGAKIVFREGRTKAVGEITKINQEK